MSRTRTARTAAALAAAGAVAAVPLLAGAAQAAPAAGGQPQERQLYSYAVLQAPGWTLADDNDSTDATLRYVNGDDVATLAWHPAGTDRAPFTVGEKVGATTMDGDRSPVFDYQAIPTAVGPTTNGQFLTLSSTTLDDGELGDLAGQVHRTAVATIEAQNWYAVVGNVPSDDKLDYAGPRQRDVVLNWRDAASRSKFLEGRRVGTATLEGRRVPIVRDGHLLTVVGPKKAGTFLTLSSTDTSKQVLARLAKATDRR